MALAIETLLPTPAGWTSVYDLSVGDVLFDELGYLTKVTSVSKPRREVCYDMQVGWGKKKSPEQGILCTSDQELYSIEHIRFEKLCDLKLLNDMPSNWPVWTKQDGGHRKHSKSRTEAQVFTVEEVSEKVVRTRSHGDLRVDNYLNHHIPTTFPLALPPRRDLAVDPYVLGCIINQFDTSTRKFVTTERFYDYYAAQFARGGYVLSRSKKSESPYGFVYCSASGKLSDDLRQVGYQTGKIPAVYLRASAEQRMALLSGLLDKHTIKDRLAKSRQAVSYATTNAPLAQQVADLVRSLGFPAYIYDEPEADRGRSTRIVYWHPAFTPYRHPLWQTRYSHQVGRAGNQLERYVWKVYSTEKDGEHVVRDISVDSHYGLFAVSELYLPMKGTSCQED